MADDLEVDIPKFWDFLAEILSPLFLCECLTIADYHSLFNDVGINYKTPKAVSRYFDWYCVNLISFYIVIPILIMSYTVALKKIYVP